MKSLGELLAKLEAINRAKGRVVIPEAPVVDVPEPVEPTRADLEAEAEVAARIARPVKAPKAAQQTRLPYRDD